MNLKTTEWLHSMTCMYYTVQSCPEAFATGANSFGAVFELNQTTKISLNPSV